MGRHARAVALLVCAWSSSGCGDDRAPPLASGLQPERAAADPSEAPALALLSFPRKLTDGDIARRGLDGQIDELSRLASERSPAVVHHAPLVGALLARAQYFGTYADFGQTDTLTQQLVGASAHVAEAHVLRASHLSSVHHFDAAEAEIEAAVALGDQNARRALSTYAIARGEHLEDALAERQAVLERAPTYGSLVDVAAAQAALGDFESADARYVEALELYRDVSPLPVAWVYFQRGVMWGEMANEPARARALYAEAVRILPRYVAANVHLAEREHADGEVERAIARLERIAITTDDPEPKSRLAQYLEPSDPARALALSQEVDVAYRALLAKHDAAFLDHAAEFYAAAGKDPDRALQVALRNLTLRRNARAYLVALGAAEAANDIEAWCRLATEARDASQLHRNLAAALMFPAFACKR